MPLLRLQSSVPIPESQRGPLSQALSSILAACIGKPESYVMIALDEGPICMGGELGPAAFADVRSIGGLSGTVNKQIASQVSAKLEEVLGIPAARIFLNFTDVPAASWGHRGTTFG